MKRTFTIVAAMLAATAQMSCIKSDWSDCPPDVTGNIEGTSLTLTFDMADEPPVFGRAEVDGQTFNDLVSSVDVYLFDEDLRFVRQRRVEKVDLERFKGTVFDEIEPGTYSVVCWGNLSEHTNIPQLEVGTPLHNLIISIKTQETGGPVYYAPNQPIETFVYDWGGNPPTSHATYVGTRSGTRGLTRDHEENHEIYIAEVVAGQDNVKPLEFENVHRKVQVYVKGWEYAPKYDGQLPMIENCHSSNVIDFYLDVDTTPASLMQEGQLTVTPEGLLPSALFYSARAPFNDLSGVCLFNQTSNTIETAPPVFSLEYDEWVAENDWENDGDMAIMIEFSPGGGDDDGDGEMDVNVSVTVPSWLRHDVTPEFR